MARARNVIAFLVFVVVCVTGIFMVRKTDLLLSLHLETNELAAESMSIEGYVISLPLKQYFVKGTVSVDAQVFNINKMKYICNSVGEANTYMLFFGSADRGMVGEIALRGNIMANSDYGYISGVITDAVQNRMISFRAYLKDQ